MKRNLFLLVLLATSVGSFANPPISDKVMRAFQASFSGASKIIWTEFDDFYQVYFVKDGAHCRVNYNFRGNIIQSRRDYDGNKLQPFLAGKLHNKFPDQKIYVVTEISNDAETFYIIHLHDQKDWVKVRCEQTGEIAVLERLRKE